MHPTSSNTRIGRSHMKSASLFFLVLGLMSGGALAPEASHVHEYGIFRVLADGRTVEMHGIINGNTLENFSRLVANHPDIRRIHMIQSDGSSDGRVNLQTALRVHELGLHVHLADNGDIHSGAVDFYLSGRTRSRGENTRFGVHSWGSHDGLGNPIEGRLLAKDDPMHLLFLEYYRKIGLSREEAEAFYRFTLESAPFDSMHIMTEEEIRQFNLVPAPEGGLARNGPREPS